MWMMGASDLCRRKSTGIDQAPQYYLSNVKSIVGQTNF